MQNPTTLALCLAGLGKRFSKQGYKTPKYLLKNSSKVAILELIISSFISSGTRTVIYTCNQEHVKWKATILAIQKKFPEIEHITLFVPSTHGQAETAYKTSLYINEKLSYLSKKPVAFHNGDTILIGRNLNDLSQSMMNSESLGMIDTFKSNDPAMSYVQSRGNLINEIKEKEVISEMASTGLYLFKDIYTYMEFYLNCNFKEEEHYISYVYQKILESNNSLMNNYNKDPRKTIILGTPNHYKFWLKNG